MPPNSRSTITVSAKLPRELATELDVRAMYRGVTRSWLVRELVEAFVDGRVVMTPPRRSQGMSLADLAASDVGRAADRSARGVVAAAVKRASTALRDVEATPDAGEIARLAAAHLGAGR